MDEIALEIEHTPSSSSDISRDEEKWTAKHEEFLEKIKEKCLNSKIAHRCAGSKTKKMYQILTAPGLILPLTAAFLESYIDSPQWVSAALILVSTGTSAVNAFLNFGKKSQQHLEFEGRYDDLFESIELTLSRRKKSREQCDVCMTKFLSRHALLNSGAPHV